MEIMCIENAFNSFMQCLVKAGAKTESHYFKLPVAGTEEAIFRERVYCYELYHQLRCLLGDVFPYYLHGEVDKAGHPIIPDSYKPDFIFHVPGEMNRNLVVIEVKPVTADLGEINNDLEKLQCFLNKDIGYYWAIMLIYGDNESKFENIKSKIQGLNGCHLQNLLLVWHQAASQKPHVFEWRNGGLEKTEKYG